MSYQSHLSQHESSSVEHARQAKLLADADELLVDQDMESLGGYAEEPGSTDLVEPAPVVQNLSAVDDACSLLPPDILKNWTSEYQQKQASPQDFLELFPPTSERGRPPSKKNAFYFERQHEGKLGPASVAAYALHHNRELACVLDPATVLWTHLLTYLGSRLRSARDRTVLAALLGHAVHASGPEYQTTSTDEFTPRYNELPIPSDPKEFNRTYVEGKYSVPKNIPRPTPEELDGGFAYIPVTECVRDVFAHGHFVEPLVDNLEGLFPEEAFARMIHSASKRGKEILTDARAARQKNRLSSEYYTSELILWSDGFDPSTGAKSNRGSVWCCFISIATPASDVHSGCTTYLVSIGPSSGCKDEVERRISEDLKVLSCDGDSSSPLKVYHGGLKKEVEVFAQLFAIIQDRPERSASARILSGNSILTARWGYTGKLSAVYEILPACKSCFRDRLLGNCWQVTSCDQCHNWAFEDLRYPAPPEYPAVGGCAFCEDGVRTLKFKKITIADMKAACSRTHHRMLRGEWSDAQGGCYLRTHGIVPALIDRVVNHASEIRATISAAMGGDEVELAAFNTALEEDPTITQQLPDPPTWNFPNTELCDFIDTIMHQLFLGVTKTFYSKMVLKWLKSHSKAAPYLRSLSEPNKEVESLHLSWAKARQVGETGKFGGLVSEDYIWMARASKWLHAGIASLPATDTQYQDPDREFQDYTAEQIKAWFKHRNLPYNKDANAATTNAAWKTYLESLGEQEPPPIVEDETEKIPAEVVEQLITSLLPMMARIMLSGPIMEAQILDAERHIKIFLSCVENFDVYRTRREKPLWASSYNFVSLLNLPSLMRRYGSLRMLWEGDGKGEGALRSLKRLIINGLKGNWAFCTALRYFKEKAMKHMLRSSIAVTQWDADSPPTVNEMLKVARSIIGEEEDDAVDGDMDDNGDNDAQEDGSEQNQTNDTGKRRYRFDNYNAYKELAKVRQDLNRRNRPISIVALEQDKKFAIILQGGTSFIYLKREEFKKTVCGASYFRWSLENAPTEYTGGLPISNYCLLLPLALVSKGNNEDSYYLITASWKEMLEDGTIDLPRIPGALYS